MAQRCSRLVNLSHCALGSAPLGAGLRPRYVRLLAMGLDPRPFIELAKELLAGT